MSFVALIALLCTLQLAGTLAMFELGRRLAARRLAREPNTTLAGGGVAEGAVPALLSLLIAFTFSGAATRFDERRRLVVEETNAIGTAYLRLDVVAPDARDALRSRFREYLDARLAIYRALPDRAAVRVALARSQALQQEIWQAAVRATRDTPSPSAMLLLPALNTMFDITTTRTMAAWMHPPLTIYVLLGVLVLVSAFFAGYSMAANKQRSRIHVYGFAITLAVAVYVILDLEYPRLGLLRVDAFDNALVELRRAME